MKRELLQKIKYPAVLVIAAAIIAGAVFLIPGRNRKQENIAETVSSEMTASETPEMTSEETEETETTAESTETTAEESTDATETEVSETETPETSETAVEETEGPEPVTEAPATTAAEPEQPHASGSVKEMIRLGLSYVSASYGYSLYDRIGASGNFDCSGLIAVLLRDGLGEPSIGWFGTDAWDTAYWRYFASLYAVGNRVQIGNTVFEVTMRDSYEFDKAWAVPGSIVIQYPPENDPETKMGHASIALGTIPYESTQDVIDYLKAEYGVDLSGMAGGPNGIPKVYDQYGPDSGHVTWKINANGIAACVCVDNNYASRPEWIEEISIVLTPVQ